MNFQTARLASDPAMVSRQARILEGKTAIVTGAGAGIGRSIALLFATEGANVIVADRSRDDGNDTADAIEALAGTARFFAGDVRDPEYHEFLVSVAVAAFGRLDIAVNNAGISLAPTPLADVSRETWERIVAVNLTGAFYAMRAQIPAMIEAGGGAIVNIASAAGVRGVAGIGPYVASKHGLVGLTKTAAIEYAQRGIRANTIAPGFIDTRFSQHFSPEERASLAARHPMNRLGQVYEVAEMALFLASARSAFVTGACVPIDGGILAQMSAAANPREHR